MKHGVQPTGVAFTDHLWANMALSTKPKVHNVLHCRQRRTEPRPHVTCTGNFEKFGHVVFEICERTGVQTDTEVF